MMVMPMKSSLFTLLVSVAVVAVLMRSVSATAMNFTVTAGEEVVRTISLSKEDRVLVSFTVIGGQSDNTIDFSITYTNGTVQDFGMIGGLENGFLCDKDGQCLLHFSNLNGSENKLVSLDYEVQHYVLGMPQMLFLTVVIVVVCVAAVAVFILMARRH